MKQCFLFLKEKIEMIKKTIISEYMKYRKYMLLVKILWIIFLITQIYFFYKNLTCICPLNSTKPLAMLFIKNVTYSQELCNLYC
jgi:hypothetical protein